MNLDARTAIAERRSLSLTMIVRRELERMILTGELGAGERLNEKALAQRLGVSRGPVREAARALERDGLVTSIVNHGVFVRQVSFEDAIELYELRAHIVGYVCWRLAQTARGEEVAELRGLVGRMDDAIRAEDAAAYYDLNLEFHNRVIEMSRCRKSAELYQSLVKEAHLFRRRSLMTPAAMRASNREHRRIVKAIRTGDAPAARTAAEEHHMNGKQRWLETLR